LKGNLRKERIFRRVQNRTSPTVATSQAVGGSGTVAGVEYVVPLAVVNEAPGVSDSTVTSPVSLKSAAAVPAVKALAPAPSTASLKNRAPTNVVTTACVVFGKWAPLNLSFNDIAAVDTGTS